MLALKVKSVFEGVRALMNDTESAIYTDIKILPYFQIAYEDFKTELQDYNVPITIATSEGITVPSGTKNIGGNGGPALPADLVDVLTLWERPAGSTTDYLMMERRQVLPKTEVQTAYLQYWSWQNQIIKFLGATGDIEVKIDYIAQTLTTVLDGNSLIRANNCLNFLQFRTAALCSQFVGENETRADSLNKNADRTMDTLLSICIKTTQSIATRRRPFMANRRRAGPNWWG